MDMRSNKAAAKPPLWLALLVSAALVTGWAVLRLHVFEEIVLPLTYVLPLMVMVWTRRAWLLWTVAALFAVLLTAEVFRITPTHSLPPWPWTTWITMMINVVVGAVVLHIMMVLRERLEARHAAVIAANEQLLERDDEISRQNKELARQNEELQTQSEELAQQNEEITSQAEELERQTQELENQAEDLRITRDELAQREGIVTVLLESARTLTPEREVLARLCQSAAQLLGAEIRAAAVVERQADELVVHAQHGFGSEGPSYDRWRWEHSLAALVVKHKSTASLEDVALRPDIDIPQPRSGEKLRSILAAPLCVGGSAIGAVEFYSASPQQWTAQQFRLAEWVAAQCSIILETLRLQKALQEATRRLRTTLESITDAFFSLDAEWRFTYVNQEAERLLLRKREELLGRSIWECFPEAVGSRFQREYEQAVKTGVAVHFDEFYPPLETWFDVHAYPSAEGISIYFNNINQRKRDEVDLKHAKDAAEQASAAKDHFLAVLSHELRTPLTPVLMSVSSMETEEAVSPLVREQLAMIRRNVELEARLIDDLLDLTRIARGKLSLRRTHIDMHNTIDAAVDICRAAESERGRSRIVPQFEASSPRVFGDASRLQQVVWNLISNALKFSPPENDILVRTEDAGQCLRIQVIDRGRGIEPELLPRLFQAFEQGGVGTTRRFGGLGLGLAISKAIVEMHGGSIRADSQGIGHGATFTVELPLAGEQSPGSPACLPQPQKPAASEPRRRAKLLLVEDHVDSARTIGRLLECSGYTVRIAHTVAAAIAAAQDDGKIDLVVSDLGLPDGTGHQLMDELSRRHGLRGIALSGYGTDEDLRRSASAGFIEHLTKPVNFDRLEETIARALKQVGEEQA